MNTVQKIFVLLFVAFPVFYWWKIRVRTPKGYKLPPGPPGKFLIGNLLDIPLQKEWLTCRLWSKIYGDLTYLNICGTSILFVNSHELVSELFDQRGGIYSNRVHSTMVTDLVGWDWTLITRQPDENWKRHRAIIHQYLGRSSAILQYRGHFEKSARTLLRHLYTTPDKFAEHTRHVIGGLIMELTYGIKTLPENDPYVELADSTLALIAEVAAPGACLVDFFPILKYVPSWVPGAGFQKKAKRLSAKLTAMRDAPFNAVKTDMEAGNLLSSIVGGFLEEITNKEGPSTAEEVEDIRQIGATIYIGSIDTTETALQIFFLAMILYPDIQEKAQKELDNVIGRNTLPSLDDRKNLPYAEALCKEVLRWHPPVPLASPHLLKEDDIIGEYFVPKGTIVLGNGWSLVHSEAMYGKDVEKFNPERFLRPDAKYPDSSFGFGRRICPGRHLADAMIFTMITNVLYAYSITPYEGLAGPEMPDVDAFTPGLISAPRPFKCKITPRSSQIKTLLEQLSVFE